MKDLVTIGEILIDLTYSGRQNGVPVYLTGSQAGFEYASKQAFAELGIRVLPPMSPVAAYVMLWLL